MAEVTNKNVCLRLFLLVDLGELYILVWEMIQNPYQHHLNKAFVNQKFSNGQHPMIHHVVSLCLQLQMI